MKLLYMALSAALAGTVLAGCSDSGGGSTPAASTAQPAATPAEQPVASPAAGQPADAVTEEQAQAAPAAPEVDMTEPVVDVTDIPAPPLPASITDLGGATDEELRRELEELRPVMADLRDKYRAIEIPLRERQRQLKAAIGDGDAAEVARLREEQQALARDYLPAINAFREARGRVRAIEEHLRAAPAEPAQAVSPAAPAQEMSPATPVAPLSDDPSN